VAEYNKGIGYVDLMNHMKVNHSVSLTCKYPLYMGIIFYVLELSIINALVVFRQLGHEDLRHLDFRKQLITQLAARTNVPLDTIARLCLSHCPSTPARPTGYLPSVVVCAASRRKATLARPPTAERLAEKPFTM